MSKYGADVAELRSLAAQFDRTAERLDAGRMAVGNAIQISAWVGPFATQFRVQWNSEHSARIRGAVEILRESAQSLRRNADDQERASAVEGGVGGSAPQHFPVQDLWPTRAGGFGPIIDGIESGVHGVIDAANIGGNVNDIVETMRGSGRDIISNLRGGKFLSASLKGIGLGSAAVSVAEGVRDHDWSGAMGSAADGVFTFATAPVSLLWQGLKAEIGFFIPLDKSSQDEHLAWMVQRGYSANQVVERYSGIQGFIELGNDNVERKAPWLNRIAEKVMEKPATWLYDVGIRLG